MAEQINIKDLAALEKFLKDMQRYNETLAREFDRQKRAWSDTQRYWSDPQSQKYDVQLNDLSKNIKKYLEQSEEPVKHLKKLIARARGVTEM